MDSLSMSCTGRVHHGLRKVEYHWSPQQKLIDRYRLSVPPSKRTGRIRSTLTVPSNAPVTLPTGRRSRSASNVRELQRQTQLPDVEEKQRKDAQDAFWDYQFLYKSQRNEVDSMPLTLIEGALPSDLCGVYYLCGPGILSDDHGSQVHPLDGHGYLRKFAINGANPVLYSARYVDTEARKEEYDEENKTWKFSYRGPFSLLRGGDRFGNVKVMKNVANTSVLQWAGKLMCLYEGGPPYEMDSKSLQTLGLFDMEAIKVDLGSSIKQRWRSVVNTCTKLGALSSSARSAAVGLLGKFIQPVLKGVFEMPEERMLSHVKIDLKRQRLVVMTCRREDMVLPKSTFTVYEMDLSMQVLQRKVFTLNEQLMIHDWGLTDNHYVLLANRVRLNTPGNLAGSLAGLQPMINCLALDDSLPYTPMYLLPRDVASTSKRNWRIPVKVPERLWFIHAANSFEETDEYGNLRVTLDGTACSYDWFSLMHMFGYEWQKRWLDPTFMNTAAKVTKDCRMRNPVQLIRVSTLVSTDGNEIDTNYKEFENNRYACDFPAIHPQTSGSKNQHTYLVGASGRRRAFPYFPFDTVLKISGDAPAGKVRSWWAGSRNFVGEPVFVPRSGSAPHGHPDFVEDDGYLITVQYAAAEEVCYLVILDARRIGGDDVVVARLRLPAKYAFPYGFHGIWTELDAEPSIIGSQLSLHNASHVPS